ncbi:hypothetical protein FQR65_LT06784 [Abscondita terminalis]|nr:hypothetical protein FQR65_LT06784 [Abscondita terminalis]
MDIKIVFMIFVALHVASCAEFVCETGQNYKENNCNNCRCNDGKLTCTMKSCNGPEYDKMFNCVAGTTYKNNCNDCWCTKEYGTVCTAKTC